MLLALALELTMKRVDCHLCSVAQQLLTTEQEFLVATVGDQRLWQLLKVELQQ